MEIDAKILAGLERIQTATLSLLQQRSHVHGLTPLQIRILSFIRLEEAYTVSTLAKNLGISKPTVSEAVRVLDSKKLIRKKASGKDGRTYSIHLTSKGCKLIEAAAMYDLPLRKTLTFLDGDQKDSLWEALLNLIRIMEEQGLIPHNRMCLTCTHLGKNEHGARYFCRLMQAPLKVSALRINCPEHQAQGAVH
ncbi:MAG: winged helix-turn-helix transcriptional regulator [Alphaproteobacteria bacterium]|nr:winged helix-turn-helix transcriptional regulator [Alphaproteobacteria bacterium]MBP7763115.1 winged helix-turn-helix transcriptional regulator [Alphaproteobacteria bacterium]MBP7906003.1 winged helix-turn-helix transcriptional regulator [Alphaproteobacteria bacterium]